MENKKIQWIENLRVIACMSVVMIHVISGWLDVSQNIDIDGFRWILDNVILQVLIRHAVPVFIMISGYLLLNPNRVCDIEKIKKYILKTIICIFLFAFIFSLFENIINYGFNNIALLIGKSFINVIQEESWAHMWYLYMLIGIYILTPILRKFVKYAKEEEIKFTLLALLITAFIIPTINNIFGLNITSFYLGNSIFSFIFYFMVGYYIGNNKIIKEKNIYFWGMIGVIGYVIFCFAKSQFSVELLNNNIFTCLYSILVYKSFSSGKINFKSNKLIKNIAKYSFGIYIIHTFWLNLLNKGLNIYPDVLPCFIGETVFFIYALLFSYISVFIMSKIPFIKNII